MPRYFIDTADGCRQSRDDEGEEFSDVETARQCALAHLPAFGEDAPADGEIRDFSVTLRGAGGAPLYVARLSYHSEWTNASVRRTG